MAREQEIQPFVKIQIASPGASKPKEIRLSRMQFEFLFFMIPIIFLWGLASTAILVKTLYFDRPQTNAIPLQGRARTQDSVDLALQNQTPAPNKVPARAEGAISSTKNLDDGTSVTMVKSEPANDSLPEKTESAPAQVAKKAERSFKVEDIFDVDVSVESPYSKAPVSITVAMTNLSRNLDAGRYWLSVMAVTKKGQKIWLTPMPEVKIDDQGQAKNPERGHAYSFRNFRKQKLSVTSPRLDIVRFETFVIGFVRAGKSPAIVKTQLVPR